MRILFCTLDYAPIAAGGAEHQAQLQADELARRGHEVHVVCPRRGDAVSGLVGAVRVHRLRGVERRPFQTATTALALAAYLIRNAGRFDVVHLHIADLRTDMAVLICGLRRKPVYVKLAAGGPAGDIGRLRKIAHVTRYFGLRHAACLQAISAEIEGDISALAIPLEHVAVIPNGIDLTTFRPATREQRLSLRRSLGFPDTRPVVLFLGRFAAYKGIGDLLEAWTRVRANCDAELVFVGFVAVEDPYHIPSDTPGVSVREWTGNPVPFYQAADVFVLPSHVEGMSNALLEAMACGLPVVTTSVGAAPQMLRDGVDGHLVRPRDPAALAEALVRSVSDPSARETIGGAAVRNVSERYSLSVVVDQIEARYLAIKRPSAVAGATIDSAQSATQADRASAAADGSETPD